jgi:hypothetical protein
MWLDLDLFEAVLVMERARGSGFNGSLAAKLLADLAPAAAAAAHANGAHAGGAAASLTEGELLSLRCAGALAACEEAPLDEA